MYNPKFTEFNQTVQSIVQKHSEELLTLKTTWKELKDDEGYVYQIVPIIDITFKS
ncbi:MAG: hypothetical protein ACXABY_25950 [Candidatus Thorarchaeota archaeon]|jgi:hypothetical protein